MRHLISIITPVYNSSEYIRNTLDSVITQTYSNWEHLLVDDCSTDDSVAIIEEYVRKDIRFKLFKLDLNSGSGPARNLAIKNANGKYIAFLDSDDIWIAERLELHVKYMVEHNHAVSHASYGYLTEQGEIFRKPYLVSTHPVDYKYLLKHTDISCLTAMYDQEQIGKFFMPALRRKQDYALWLAILKAGYKSVPYPREKVLAYYRQRKGSATSNKWSLLLKHYTFLRKQEGIGRLGSLFYTFHWVTGGFKKHYLNF